MEGVIFETNVSNDRGNVGASVWALLPRILGDEAVKDEAKGVEMWNKGTFKNYFEWCDYAFKFYKKHNLTEKKFYKVINNVPFMNGAKETIKELQQRGYMVAMISGGIKNLANRAIREIGIHHSMVAVELFFDEKTGKLSGWNMLPCDYEGKIDFMELMMREYKLKPKECAFIGDGVNDIPLAKEVGLSIAFNGRKELQEVTTYSVNQEAKDLKAILKYFP